MLIRRNPIRRRSNCPARRPFSSSTCRTSTLQHPNDDQHRHWALQRCVGARPRHVGSQRSRTTIAARRRSTRSRSRVRGAARGLGRITCAAKSTPCTRSRRARSTSPRPRHQSGRFRSSARTSFSCSSTCGIPLLKDPVVRQALSYAVDRQAIIDLAHTMQGVVADGPIWPYHWAYSTAQKTYAHNIEAATLRLESAGLRIKPRQAGHMPSRLQIQVPDAEQGRALREDRDWCCRSSCTRSASTCEIEAADRRRRRSSGSTPATSTTVLIRAHQRTLARRGPTRPSIRTSAPATARPIRSSIVCDDDRRGRDPRARSATCSRSSTTIRRRSSSPGRKSRGSSATKFVGPGRPRVAKRSARKPGETS